MVGVSIFLATFNADRYRPLIVKELEKALGKPVELRSIGLGWHNGIALQLKGLKVFAAPGSSEELFHVDSAGAVVRLRPLLKKNLQVSSLIISEPKITLIKGPGGGIRGLEKKPARPREPRTGPTAPVPVESAAPAPSAPAPAGETRREKSAAPALAFLADEIRIENGVAIYRDESSAEPAEIELKNIDVTLENVALDRPMQITGSAGLLSGRQNVDLQGTLRVSSREETGYLENLIVKADLNQMQAEQLFRAVPALRTSGLQEWRGAFTLQIGALRLDEKSLEELQAQALLQGGEVKFAQFGETIRDITLEAVGRPQKIDIQNFSAQAARGTVSGTGSFNASAPVPLSTFQLAVKGVDLQTLLPPPGSPRDPSLTGIFSANFQGTARGTDARVLGPSLAGEGELVVENGVVLNLNILREIFSALSLIPGLVRTLEQRLPEGYQQKIEARDTVLGPVEIPFVINGGVLSLRPFQVATDSFALQAGGNFFIGGGPDLRGALFIDPELSRAMIQSVQELQTLAGRDGRIQIPFSYRGRTFDEARFLPDLQSIGSRLAAAKIGSLLQPKTAEPANADPNAAPSPQKPKDLSKMKGRDIFGQLLQGAFAPPADE